MRDAKVMYRAELLSFGQFTCSALLLRGRPKGPEVFHGAQSLRIHASGTLLQFARFACNWILTLRELHTERRGLARFQDQRSTRPFRSSTSDGETETEAAMVAGIHCFRLPIGLENNRTLRLGDRRSRIGHSDDKAFTWSIDGCSHEHLRAWPTEFEGVIDHLR